jgi:hypothetical protein
MTLESSIFHNVHYAIDEKVNLSHLLDGIKGAIDHKLKSFEWYKPYPVFKEFHKLGKDASVRLLLAANRIGKTYSCLAEFAMHVTASYPDDWEGYRYTKKNMTMWLGGLTSFEINSLSQRLFEGKGRDPAFIQSDLVIHQNLKDRHYKIKNALGGITNLHLKTYGGREQKNELSNWKADQVDCILLDEQPTMSVFSECCMRIMGTGPDDHGMILIAATCTQFTPFVLSFTERAEEYEVDRLGQKVTEFKQVSVGSGEIRDGKVFLLAGWEDAEHLSEKEKKDTLANMRPFEIAARTKGMPSIGSGMVYPIIEEAITCDPFPIPDYWPRVFGLDFGWKDPTAAIFCAFDRDNDITYFYAEYAVSELTPQHHALELIRQGANWMFGVYDPAGRISSQQDGSKLVDLYRQSGIKFLSPANNSRELGVQTVLQRMQRGKLKIFKTLTKTMSEYRTYARDENGIIKDGNDHLLDCIRYVIMSGLPLAKCKNENKYSAIPKFGISNMNNSEGRWMGRGV